MKALIVVPLFLLVGCASPPPAPPTSAAPVSEPPMPPRSEASAAPPPAPASPAERPAAAPPHDVDVVITQPKGGVTVKDALFVLTKRKDELRDCFLGNGGTKKDDLVTKIRLGPNGAVTGVDVVAAGSLPDGVVQCALTIMKQASFAGPGRALVFDSMIVFTPRSR